MKVFVTGDQEPQFIENCLEHLAHYYTEITCICGLATTPCMDTIVPLCDDEDIPLNLYLPSDDKLKSIIQTNEKIINKERPDVLLIFSENMIIENSLISIAAQGGCSIRYIIRQNQ